MNWKKLALAIKRMRYGDVDELSRGHKTEQEAARENPSKTVEERTSKT